MSSRKAPASSSGILASGDADESMGWLYLGPSVYSAFAGTLVEFLEALTIVLAVGASRGWRGALTGAGLALLLLLALLAVLGDGIRAIPLLPLQLVLGSLTLLFGIRWLRKAMLRAAGVIPLRNEMEAYARQRTASGSFRYPRGRWDAEAIGTTFRVTLLEGVEAVFVVLATGAASPGGLLPASLAAAAALLVVCLLGIMLRRPVVMIPDNLLKLGVGVSLCALGTFWIGEGEAVMWPGGGWSLLTLLAGYAAAAAAGIAWCRNLRDRRQPPAASAMIRSRPETEGTPILRKSLRLFSDDVRSTAFGTVWLVLSLLLLHSLASAWRGAFLFSGFCTTVVLGAIARTPR